MTFWDILDCAQYYQQFEVYVTNAYDQNLLIGNGDREDMLSNDTIFHHLMDKVEYFTVRGYDSTIVLFIRDKHFEELLQKQYDESYTKTWRAHDPKSRPFKYSSEIHK